MSTEMAISRARAEISDIANRAAYCGETIYLTKNGRRSAAVVPALAAELLEQLEEWLDIDKVRAVLADIANGKETRVPFVRRTRQGNS